MTFFMAASGFSLQSFAPTLKTYAAKGFPLQSLPQLISVCRFSSL